MPGWGGGCVQMEFQHEGVLMEYLHDATQLCFLCMNEKLLPNLEDACPEPDIAHMSGWVCWTLHE